MTPSCELAVFKSSLLRLLSRDDVAAAWFVTDEKPILETNTVDAETAVVVTVEASTPASDATLADTVSSTVVVTSAMAMSLVNSTITL